MEEVMSTYRILESLGSESQPILLAGSPVQRAKKLEIASPWNSQFRRIVSQANEADAETALAAIDASFSVTRALSGWQRSSILQRVSDLITKDATALAQLIALEAGKSISDSRLEVTRAVQTFRVAAEEAKRIGGEILPLDWTPGSEHRVAMTQRVPVGPILGISPFNFPLNLIAHKLAPAIATGNPIIIKPSPFTPVTALSLGMIAVDAGWPKEAISVLPCDNKVAEILLRDDRIRKLSFTGSAEVGWRLKSIVPKKHVTLELGGNAAVIVNDDADISLAAQKILQGGFTYSGQSCISVQRVFVHEDLASALIEKVSAGIQKLVSGDPFDEATQLGPMINEEAAVRAYNWIRAAVDAGAKLIHGGNRNAFHIDPTLLSEVPNDTLLAQEEVFAPVAFINKFSDFSQALAAVNRSRFGLQVGLFTQRWSSIAEAWRTLEVGAILINESPAWRVEHQPYGGVKDSGFGREGIRSAIEAMTESRLLILSR
jgi:acyl-CoA reductase-like NAD-dependent aldehyde dehydrogenase